ncbi:uncharacterized protein [Bemisia tabaci]|uniref:uncharacterized protein isoform X1 n=2 Tax=Bemisia tabaci TaxID=7038 RepID=UPI003B281CBB
MNSRHLISNILCLVCSFGIYKSEQTTKRAIGNFTIPALDTLYSTIPPESIPAAEDIKIEKEDFDKIVKSSAYIDKTWFIRDVFDLPRYSVITGPRGFSKTTNLNMLKYFFEHELDACYKAKDPKLSKKVQAFKDKKVFTDEKFFWQHFAKYPVIHIDQSSVSAKSFDHFLKSFVKNCIDPLVVKFGYLLNSTDVRPISKTERSRFVKGYNWTKEELQEFGADLAGLLFQHHGTKPILLIDEYDFSFVSALLDASVLEKDTEAIMQFLGTFVAEMVKNNHDTTRAVLTGCLGLKLEYDYFGGAPIPNVHYLTIFESKELYSAYGFLERDIDELEKRFAIPPTEMEVLRLYYRGYNVYENIKDTAAVRPPVSSSMKIYNTLSVLHALRGRTMDKVWSGGHIKKLQPLLKAEKWGPHLEECMLRRCKITVKGPLRRAELMELKKSLLNPVNPKSGHFMFQLLLELGYFTVEEKRGFSYTIIPPNFEVQTIAMDEFYHSNYLMTRYGFTLEDEMNYVASLEQLSSNTTSLHTLVRSVQALFRNLVPRDETFMLVVLFYPLLNCSEFATFRIEQYTSPSPSSRFAVFARRRRDLTGIMFDMKTGPGGLQHLDRARAGPLSNIFKQFPDLKDTVDLRLVASAKNEVYGFYNYTVFNGNSTCELWPPLKNISRVDSGIRLRVKVNSSMLNKKKKAGV